MPSVLLALERIGGLVVVMRQFALDGLVDQVLVAPLGAHASVLGHVHVVPLVNLRVLLIILQVVYICGRCRQVLLVKAHLFPAVFLILRGLHHLLPPFKFDFVSVPLVLRPHLFHGLLLIVLVLLRHH
jgi:hypothetical protein